MNRQAHRYRPLNSPKPPQLKANIQRFLHFVVIFWGVGGAGLGISFTVEGQTLTELQQAAVQNRALIEKYRLVLESARHETALPKGRFWPSIDLNYGANALDQATPFETKENSRLGGIISFNLFSGFRDRYRLAAAKQAEIVSAHTLQSIAQDLQLDIALLYLDLYEKNAFVGIADDQLALIEKRLADTQNRFAVGLVSKNEVLRLTVERNETLQRQRRAVANVAKSRNQLAFATDSDIQAPSLLFREFDALPEVISSERLKSQMLENRSELNGLKTTVQLLEENAQAARADIWPTADIAGGYTRFGDDFLLNKDDEYQDETRVQLQVSLNLFDGFQKYERIRQARLEVARARLDLIELEKQLVTELNNRFIDLTVAQENLAVAQSAIAEAEENVRITEEAYKAGVETATDILNAILNLTTARFNLTSARNNVFRNFFFLQRTIEGFPARPAQ